MKSLVTIIIPVYNAERWLCRCLNSVINQTYQNLEILLINDGSLDGSANICDEYATKDHRIRVIHQKNCGVSASRQKGIDYATGEYLIHVDSDDWVDKDMIAQLYSKAIEGNYDMVICDYYEEFIRKNNYCCQNPNTTDTKSLLHKFLFQQLHGSCCNKLVSRVCYNMPNVSFPQGVNIYEDLYVTCQMLHNNIRVGYLPKAFYHYFIGYSADTLSVRITLKSTKEKICFIELMSQQPFINNPNELYYFKKDVLFSLFYLHQYTLLNQIYPEIKEQVLSEHRSYHVMTPNGYVLKTALKGSIFKARAYLFISSIIIKSKNMIKSL